MLTALLLSLVFVFLLYQSSFGLVAQQVHRASNLLMSPFRSDLDERFLNDTWELDRDHDCTYSV